jgi:Macrocin-O-methyltransferase (TylF)
MHGACMNGVNLTKTKEAFTKNSFGSIAEAEREQHLRSLYLQLTKEVILNNIYEPSLHIDEGRQWPPHQALSMIGRKRLDNVQELIERSSTNRFSAI